MKDTAMKAAPMSTSIHACKYTGNVSPEKSGHTTKNSPIAGRRAANIRRAMDVASHTICLEDRLKAENILPDVSGVSAGTKATINRFAYAGNKKGDFSGNCIPFLFFRKNRLVQKRNFEHLP
jgi:hypothetical protein